MQIVFSIKKIIIEFIRKLPLTKPFLNFETSFKTNQIFHIEYLKNNSRKLHKIYNLL